MQNKSTLKPWVRKALLITICLMGGIMVVNQFPHSLGAYFFGLITGIFSTVVVLSKDEK